MSINEVGPNAQTLATGQSNTLQVRESDAVQQAASLLDMIRMVACDPRMDVEKFERLLAMQERVVADQRKQAFMAAMSRLQEKLPQMDKYGQAKNSKYAKLEDIDVVIRPLLAAEGFSFSFDEEAHTEKTITFIAILAHRDGYSESRRLTVPIDVAAKNRDGQSIRPAIQDAGSTVSYARRYLIKMHLNIIEKDEDTNGESRKPITEQQALDLQAQVDEVKMDRNRFLVYMKVGAFTDILAKDWKKAQTCIAAKRAEDEGARR